jgi:hypothetical protein
MTKRASLFLTLLLPATTPAMAEPMFLSKQYARCSACHYSSTGGGLLTPYGRSLSHQELSTTGRAAPGAPPGREHEFLWGALGSRLGALQVGMDLRPAHLHLDGGDFSSSRDFFMTGDLLAAYRAKGFTVYGQLGRLPKSTGSTISSYEYWVAHDSEKGYGFRAGRFLPAYGIRLADHTAFTRAHLGFDSYDQLYAFEASRTTDRYLAQVALSPGRADSILHDDGRKAFTTTGRFEWDMGPRSALVVSGIYRGESRVDPRGGGGGLAYGIAPTSRLSIWTEADVQFRAGTDGAPAYSLLNETAFEVYRGLWLKVSPQLRTDYGDTSGGTTRLLFEADLLPRTHWNVGLSYYRDKSRTSDRVFKTFLAQLHLYL